MRPTGRTWDTKQTQTKACPVCDARFFTQVGLDEHLRTGEHSERPLVVRRRYQLSPEGLATMREVGRRNGLLRRRCTGCGRESTPAALGNHQKATGHTGWTAVA